MIKLWENLGIETMGPPEGDLSVTEARSLWPGIFLWLHPNLGWYSLGADALKSKLRAMARGAGGRFCMMISEEVPPSWEQSVPLVLGELERLGVTA